MCLSNQSYDPDLEHVLTTSQCALKTKKLGLMPRRIFPTPSLRRGKASMSRDVITGKSLFFRRSKPIFQLIVYIVIPIYIPTLLMYQNSPKLCSTYFVQVLFSWLAQQSCGDARFLQKSDSLKGIRCKRLRILSHIAHKHYFFIFTSFGQFSFWQFYKEDPFWGTH